MRGAFPSKLLANFFRLPPLVYRTSSIPPCCYSRYKDIFFFYEVDWFLPPPFFFAIAFSRLNGQHGPLPSSAGNNSKKNFCSKNVFTTRNESSINRKLSDDKMLWIAPFFVRGNVTNLFFVCHMCLKKFKRVARTKKKK